MVINVGWTGGMFPSGVDMLRSTTFVRRGLKLSVAFVRLSPFPSSSVEWAANSAICASALRAVAVISATSTLATDWTEDVELCREIPATDDDVCCRCVCSNLNFSAILYVSQQLYALQTHQRQLFLTMLIRKCLKGQRSRWKISQSLKTQKKNGIRSSNSNGVWTNYTAQNLTV